MIVKRNLSPLRVVQYTRGPLSWAALWSVVATILAVATDEQRWVVPFGPVATLGGALAIFVAFRNNSAFARWNEARAAWQAVLVACRVLVRQVVASTHGAVSSGAISAEDADRYRRVVAQHLVDFAWSLARRIRPQRGGSHPRSLTGEPLIGVAGDGNEPDAILVSLASTIKDGIREGALGQFDPISLEPQLVALNQAQGVVERIASTPTLRQYDYFTRAAIGVFSFLVPFALVGVVPGALWLVVPLSLILSGTFIVLAVTGAVNDEPFVNAVTDVPIEAICTEVEHDVCATIGEADRPALAVAVDGYLW